MAPSLGLWSLVLQVTSPAFLGTSPACQQAGQGVCHPDLDIDLQEDASSGLSLLQRHAHATIVQRGTSEAGGPVVSHRDDIQEDAKPLVQVRAQYSDREWMEQEPTVINVLGATAARLANVTAIDGTSVNSSANVTDNTNATPSAAGETGVAANAVGDGISFVMGLQTYVILITLCFLFFSAARMIWPRVYNNNHLLGKTPFEPSTSFFGWFSDALRPTTMQVSDYAGIDHAMLIEYCTLCMKICVALGVPMCLVEMPLNIWAGGNAAGQDHLSWQGMANVVYGGNIYWFYSAMTWYCVIVTQLFIFDAMNRFIKIRFHWVHSMPEPQMSTIMVENIPEEYCTDRALHAYFNSIFGSDVVAEAYIVRYTQTLTSLVDLCKSEKQHLTMAEDKLAKTGRRPQILNLSGIKDAIKFYSSQVERLTSEIENERARIHAAAEGPGSASVCAQNGFVTFKKFHDAAGALALSYNEDGDLFNVEVAPEPEDVIYTDLMEGGVKTRLKDFMGMSILALYFFSFLPVILFISTITEISTLEKWFPSLRSFVTLHPTFGQLYNSMFGSLAITLIMSFLPTLLMLVFNNFFILRSSVYSQYKLQSWYFFFLVVFVLLITSIGASLISTLDTLIRAPLLIFSLLAQSLPFSSHYYLNYIVTQWGVHAVNMVRYVNLIKYCIYNTSYGDSDYAKECSEPEDQDYYGMGSRSARFTLVMVIVLVYSTISPLIIILGFVNFAMGRVIYGYLFVFSETFKPDIGGHFYVSQLKHTQIGLFIYVVVMTGVLFQRGSGPGPANTAACAFIPLTWSYLRFFRRFRWEAVPVEFVKGDSNAIVKRKSGRSSYAQPELYDDLNSSTITGAAEDERTSSFASIYSSGSYGKPLQKKANLRYQPPVQGGKLNAPAHAVQPSGVIHVGQRPFLSEVFNDSQNEAAGGEQGIIPAWLHP